MLYVSYISIKAGTVEQTKQQQRPYISSRRKVILSVSFFFQRQSLKSRFETAASSENEGPASLDVLSKSSEHGPWGEVHET